MVAAGKNYRTKHTKQTNNHPPAGFRKLILPFTFYLLLFTFYLLLFTFYFLPFIFFPVIPIRCPVFYLLLFTFYLLSAPDAAGACPQVIGRSLRNPLGQVRVTTSMTQTSPKDYGAVPVMVSRHPAETFSVGKRAALSRKGTDPEGSQLEPSESVPAALLPDIRGHSRICSYCG